MNHAPRVKICCIGSEEEALLAIKAGASAVGLVGHMPSGPGVITDEEILHISSRIPPPISTFLLTSETKSAGIIAHHRRTYTNTIQLVDRPEPGTYQRLHDALPGVKLVQVIHVLDEKSVEEARAVATEVDALLLDSGNPDLRVKVLGGTGRTHNWDLSRRICREAGIPVFLAGGLTSANVREAIDTVRPFGVDLCNGVRTNGRLDKAKLNAFFNAI